jgi:hypothetical protein
MSKSGKLTDHDEVTAHIQKLDPGFGKVIEALRQLILNADEQIGEHIKWNNPCFYYSGEMKPFDPKEYKREIIVLNLHKNRIMLVWPSGAKLKSNTSLLEGDYKDGRRLIIFKDLDDVLSKKIDLQLAIKEWISLVDK